jgi:HPt (histidine-containing phosphotransfer) domain-containing protein
MSDKLYDLEPLNILVDGNDKFRKYLIELFVETTPPIVTDIKNSFKSQDWESLYAHTHKIKPTLESMGIYTMKTVVNDIMHSAKHKKGVDGLGGLVDTLCHTLDQAILQLKMHEL